MKLNVGKSDLKCTKLLKYDKHEGSYDKWFCKGKLIWQETFEFVQEFVKNAMIVLFILADIFVWIFKKCLRYIENWLLNC